MEQRSICSGPDAERNVIWNAQILVLHMLLLCFFLLFCCIYCCCCHHQCGHHGPAVPSAAFLPRSEDPTSRTSNKKRRTKQLHIQKDDVGREEKRRGKQSSRTSEPIITGHVATAKRKRGGAYGFTIYHQWSIQTGIHISLF